MRKEINSLLFIFYLVAGCSASGARPEQTVATGLQFGVPEITARFVYAQPPALVNSFPACGNSPVPHSYFCPNASTDIHCRLHPRFSAGTDTAN